MDIFFAIVPAIFRSVEFCKSAKMNKQNLLTYFLQTFDKLLDAACTCVLHRCELQQVVNLHNHVVLPSIIGCNLKLSCRQSNLKMHWSLPSWNSFRSFSVAHHCGWSSCMPLKINLKKCLIERILWSLDIIAVTGRGGLYLDAWQQEHNKRWLSELVEAS